jgi:hypothetical protein
MIFRMSAHHLQAGYQQGGGTSRAVSACNRRELMRQARAFMIVALAMVSAAAAACAGRVEETAAGDVALADSTSVIVDNQALNDMTIYVVEGSSRRRLGTATAVSKTQIRIPRTLVGNGRDLQFLADPFAGRGNTVSQRIFVQPGDQVKLTILP